MSDQWTCRPYQAGDEAGIIELYRDIFGIEMSLELWRWTYQSAPEGPAVIVVAEGGGRLLGHYAVQPRPFIFQRRHRTVGFAVGTMLLPQFRNVAALVEMARQAYVICRERGFPWIYAFPNDQAHRVRCALLGWKPLPEIVEWDGPLPASSAPNSASVRHWDEMPAELELEPIDSVGADETICGARSNAWLQWRFFAKPGGEYALHTLSEQSHVSAYAVTKRYRRDGTPYGHLIDWRTAPEAEPAATELLNSVWRQLAEWGVQRVSCWARGRSALGRCLSGAGLSLGGRRSNICYFDLDGSHDVQLGKSDAWRVEMADSDIY